MSASLLNRLDKLEIWLLPPDVGPRIMFLSFDDPRLETEPIRAECCGRHFTRGLFEALDAFRQRVDAETLDQANPPSGRVALLLDEPAVPGAVAFGSRR